MNEFATKEELFKHLKENKSLLIAQKKSECKKADAFSFCKAVHRGKDGADKQAPSVAELLAKDVIEVEIVVNTTRLLDSHSDVHIDGLWKKTLKEQRNLYHLQEHEMTFDHVISDQIEASARKMTWKEIGIDLDGDTEALIFNSKIEKSRNPYMFDQYARGYVKNHSVGMRYITLHLCINSDEKYYVEEKENWDKYIDQVANKEDAEAQGYFWAVTEAQVIEGSAVLVGSNWATPTQSVKSSGPSDDTRTDGPASPPVEESKYQSMFNIKSKKL